MGFEEPGQISFLMVKFRLGTSPRKTEVNDESIEMVATTLNQDIFFTDVSMDIAILVNRYERSFDR